MTRDAILPVAPIPVTPFQLAQRFLGVKEIPGTLHSPLVLAMLQLDARWVTDDETPWCSAFVNAIHWQLGLPRSKSLAARSWLRVGEEIPLAAAVEGFDVVVLSRGSNPVNGHVGFYAGHSGGNLQVLGGNQSNAVTIQAFGRDRLVGVRRIRPAA